MAQKHPLERAPMSPPHTRCQFSGPRGRRPLSEEHTLGRGRGTKPGWRACSEGAAPAGQEPGRAPGLRLQPRRPKHHTATCPRPGR